MKKDVTNEIKDVFDRYPLARAKIAADMGYTPEYIRGLARGHVKVSERRKKQLLKMFEDYFHDLGRELLNIKLTE